MYSKTAFTCSGLPSSRFSSVTCGWPTGVTPCALCEPDLNLLEMAKLIPLIALGFWIGIYPKPFFAHIEKPVQKIFEQVNPNFYQQERAKLPPAPAPAAVAEAK